MPVLRRVVVIRGESAREVRATLGPRWTRAGTSLTGWSPALYREADGGGLIYADVAVGGFLGSGTYCYVFPWENLSFDPVLDGYRVSQAEMDQIARIDKPYVSPKRLLHGR